MTIVDFTVIEITGIEHDIFRNLYGLNNDNDNEGNKDLATQTESNDAVDVINVTIQVKTMKNVRKLPFNKVVLSKIYSNGIKKMKEMNLNLVRWRTKCRLERERKVLKEKLYFALENENSTGAIAKFVERVNDALDNTRFSDKINRLM